MAGLLTRVLQALLLATARALPPNDPCNPVNHVELNQPYRSTGFEVTSPQQPLCDIDLRPGWYRFTSLAGGTMPTTCPERFKCGTIVPIWMKGDHPQVAEGIVVRTACGNFRSGGPQDDPCCDQKVDMGVKNCGNFFVYYLFPTPSCPVSYCAGSAPPCPVGKWSPTMFPPCKDAYPILKTAPTLQGPLVQGKSFTFQCEIDYNTMDPEQVFEVIWTFEGEEVPEIPPQQLTDPSRVAILDGSKLIGHLNANLECRVRTYYQGNQVVKSDYLISNTYYVGIQVSPTKLDVSENADIQYVLVNSTIPILCDHDFKCCLDFKLDVDTAKQVAFTRCIYQMCSDDWDSQERLATIEVPVIATQDMTTDGSKLLLMTFEELVPANSGPYLDVFLNHRPDQVQVMVEDVQTSTCSITGDPHIHGFDYGTYHFYTIGDYTAYQVPYRDFQVQIRTWACWSTVTCLCGVVIREKNDIIRIDQCDQIFNGPHTSPTIHTAGKLREGTIVQRSQDGRLIGVYLPSGAEVKVNAWNSHLDLYLTAPGSDRNLGRGLCGTNDGIKDNEFTYPDGTVQQICSDGDSRCIPESFTESWRLSRDKSFFENVPDPVPQQEEVRYCGCDNNAKIVDCSLGGNKQTTGTACFNCPVIPNNKLPIFNGNWRRRRRTAEYEDIDTSDETFVQKDLPDLNQNKPWPNDQGITEAQARNMCSKALQKSQLNAKCQGINNLANNYMIDCMSDILFGGTTAFLDTITESFTAECQVTLAKDPNNYVTDTEGNRVMKPEYLDDICDLNCEKHGHCGQKGVCVCNPGWEGVNCHIQSGKGPQLDKIRSGPLCDRAQRPCKTIYIDVSNINLSDDLICRVQAVDAQGNNVGNPVDTEAISLSAYRVACALPETSVSSQHYKVSASNDGSLFGNELPLHVYDSTCLDCDPNGCTPKTTACHIDNVCYQNGVKHKNDTAKFCDVTKDTTDWSVEDSVCQGQRADIIFVLDSSGSIGVDNYKKQLESVATLTRRFILGPDHVRFGVVIFGSNAQILCNLKDFTDNEALANTILSAPFLRSGTNTAEALNLITDQAMLDVPSGGRDGAEKFILLITDGWSQSRIETVAAAMRLTNKGVKLICIAVGASVNLEELKDISSYPVYQIPDLDSLNFIQEKVAMQLCGSNDIIVIEMPVIIL